MRSAWPLSAEDGHLVLNGNKFELQRRAAAKPEGEDRHNGRKNRHHARDGMPVGRTMVDISQVPKSAVFEKKADNFMPISQVYSMAYTR
jgi:hypothetical protein